MSFPRRARLRQRSNQRPLPEAAGLLRNLAYHPDQDRYTVIDATDPLNLGGIITPGIKTPSRSNYRILLMNGVPSARLLGDELELIEGAPRVDSAEAERFLRGL